MKRLFLGLLLVGCGYPGAKAVEGSPGVYQLRYCEKERKCFAAAEKKCADGYRITKWGPSRPEQFVCK